MTNVASLPTLAVSIAFNPTNVYTTPGTWTDVTQYVRDFTTNSGKQHFLDRIESSQLTLTVDNRNGYFLNGTTNGTGYVIRTRLPIKITATWNSVTYPVYYGLIDTVDERNQDALNTDLSIQASDLTKFLSLQYMSRPNFFGTYANSTNSVSWYRCDDPRTLTDSIGSNTGNVVGNALTTSGTLLYDSNNALDLTFGATSGNVAYLNVPVGATPIYSIDFWVIGAQLAGQYLTDPVGAASNLAITPSGALQGINTFSGASNPYFVNNSANICDGQWHHVGLVGYKSGTTYPLYLYLDGTYVNMGDNGAPLLAANTKLRLGNLNGLNSISTFPGYVDELVLSKDAGALATIQGEVNNRFKAGSLLGDSIASGDRIAEVLTLAGFGSISGGALSVPNYTVNDSAWATNAGTFFVQGLQSSVTGTTALDLIQQVTDTDIGVFFQVPNGTFEYDTQSYPYRPSVNVSPTGRQVLTDTSNLSITSIVGSGTTATVTLSTTYCPYTAGQTVTITGNSVSAYNGSFTIASVGTTTFTFASSSSSTGTGGVATSQTTNYDSGSLHILRDDADLWTTVKITPITGTEQVYENSAGETAYAYSTLTKSSTVHVSNNAAYETAVYLGNLYASPLPRVNTVELHSQANNGWNLPVMLNTTTPPSSFINDTFLFVRNQSGASTAGAINSRMVIERIQHTFTADPGTWITSFTLDPYPQRFATAGTYFMILDDPTYGTFLGSNALL